MTTFPSQMRRRPRPQSFPEWLGCPGGSGVPCWGRLGQMRHHGQENLIAFQDLGGRNPPQPQGSVCCGHRVQLPGHGLELFAEGKAGEVIVNDLPCVIEFFGGWGGDFGG